MDREASALNEGSPDGQRRYATSGEENIVSLGRDPPSATQTTPAPTRESMLHRVATVGMALCGVVAFVSFVAFITVRWPGGLGRYVVAAFVMAVTGAIACASVVFLSAARDTSAYRRSSEGDETPPH